MRKIWSLTSVLCLFLLGTNVFAMSSTNYWIPWDNVNSGGSDIGTSTNFSLRDTIGGMAVGTGTSANYSLSSGYRVPEAANTLSYLVKTSNTAPTTYSAFTNGVGGTVTVSSVAGISVGDLIAVVENRGFGQLVAIGRVSSSVGLVLTVDQFEGDGGVMSAAPAGGDDFVYLLNANSFDFGTVSAGVENTNVVGTSVLTNIATGYSVYLQANQNLQNASAQIMAPVTDGTVSVGSEEYGAEVTGATAVDAGTDLSVSTTQRVIQSSGAQTGTISDKVGMIFKLSIISSTNPGVYTQTVYYTLTANY
ncbi:hypothetical protein M0Q28_06610 [Patescibacteria group bacterium]|jgi:hypothetical protein|nr:hypothetical protein [Patescibacteria group bacterium]